MHCFKSHLFVPLQQKGPTQIIGVFFLMTVLVALAACSDDPSGPDGGGGATTFANVINEAGDYENPVPTGRTEEPAGSFVQEPQPRGDGTSWICREREVTIDEAPEEFVLFRDAAFGTAIYPGALLQGSTLEGDPPERVRVDRGPGTVVIALQTGEEEPTSVTVEKVDPASITEAVNTLIGNRELFPNTYSYDSVRVLSEEELRIAMNIKVSTWGVKVRSKFSFSSDTSIEHWLIRLVQPFYTINFVPPNKPEDWFAAGVTPADLAQDVGPGNPPVYVSSVTYGRIVYLLLSSTSTQTEVKASIDATAVVTEVSGSAEYFGGLDDVSVKAVVYGGEFDIAALEGSDFTAAQNALGLDQTIQLAKPISYTMADVKNDRTVAVKLGDTFTVRECIPFIGTTFDFLPAQHLGTLNAEDILPGHFTDPNREDLLFSGIQDGVVAKCQVATSTGSGTFQVVSMDDVNLSSIGAGATSVHVADLEGDGFDDVVWETQKSGKEGWVWWWPNRDGSLSGSVEAGVWCPNRNYGYFGQFQMRVGRFANPSRDALAWNLLVSAGMNIIQIAGDDLWSTCTNGDPGFSSPFWGWGQNWSYYTSHAGDFNGDGLDELVFPAIYNNTTILLWRSISREGLPPLLATSPPYGSYVPRAGTWITAVADLNDDGRSDVIWVEASAGEVPLVAVAAGLPSGNFTNPFGGSGNIEYPFEDGPFEVHFSNLDGLGGPEVLLSRVGEPNSMFVLKDFQDVTGRFGIVARIQHENPDALGSTAWSNYRLLTLDANGDGKDDLVWATDNGDIYTALAED